MTALIVAATGLVAGTAHVFTGPDHLAAVAPLAVHQRRRTWTVGLFWGVGHSSGVWILALLALLLREALPVEALSAWSERLVGFVLIGVGFWGLHRVLAARVHSHVHVHDGIEHAHVHVHDEAVQNRHAHPRQHAHGHSALGIGLLHGLAGTAHVLGILPALVLPTWQAATAYVVAFGGGSIVAMTAFAWAMGLVAHHLDRWGTQAFRVLGLSTSLAAVGVGCFWIYMAATSAGHA